MLSVLLAVTLGIACLPLNQYGLSIKPTAVNYTLSHVRKFKIMEFNSTAAADNGDNTANKSIGGNKEANGKEMPDSGGGGGGSGGKTPRECQGLEVCEESEAMMPGEEHFKAPDSADTTHYLTTTGPKLIHKISSEREEGIIETQIQANTKNAQTFKDPSTVNRREKNYRNNVITSTDNLIGNSRKKFVQVEREFIFNPTETITEKSPFNRVSRKWTVAPTRRPYSQNSIHMLTNQSEAISNPDHVESIDGYMPQYSISSTLSSTDQYDDMTKNASPINAPSMQGNWSAGERSKNVSQRAAAEHNETDSKNYVNDNSKSYEFSVAPSWLRFTQDISKDSIHRDKLSEMLFTRRIESTTLAVKALTTYDNTASLQLGGSISSTRDKKGTTFSSPDGEITTTSHPIISTQSVVNSSDILSQQQVLQEIPWPVKKEAIVEGDLVLGGLMMVHEREDTITCGPVMPQGGIQAIEAMLFTLDWLNLSPQSFLPNITLGAHILDDCDKDTYGLEMAVDFIKGEF